MLLLFWNEHIHRQMDEFCICNVVASACAIHRVTESTVATSLIMLLPSVSFYTQKFP